MKTLCSGLLSLAVLLFAARGLCAAPAAPTSLRTETTEADPSVVVSPVAVSKMRSPVGRFLMSSSLMASPAGKAAITEQAAKLSIPADRIGTVGASPFQSVTKTAANITPADAAYLRLDWSGGLTFLPRQSPTYASYHAGDTVTFGCEINSYDDSVTINTKPPGMIQSAQVTDIVVRLKLELPMQPLSYQIAVKITDRDGNAPPEWLTATPNIMPAIGLRVVYLNAHGQWVRSTGKLQSPLTTGNGYVGVFDASPSSYYKPVQGSPSTQPPTMRRYNAQVFLEVTRDNYSRPSIYHLLYGGITVSLL